MESLSRRTFTSRTLGSLMTWSLLETCSQHDLFADDVKPDIIRWLKTVNKLGREAQQQTLRQVEWQALIEKLFSKVDRDDLMQSIDFDRLTKNVTPPDNGARSLRFRLPHVDGLPTRYVFGKQIFALKKGRSVVPHGHNNMATAFLVLKGDFRGRHYDRIEDLPNSIVIKPTIDRTFRPGENSTISDYKDNVHWFQAISGPAYLFNIHVFGVTPYSNRQTGRVYLDPNGEKLAGGLIRAPRVSYKRAHALYG